MKKTTLITTGIVAVVAAGIALPALAAYENGSHGSAASTVGTSRREEAKKRRLEHRPQDSSQSSRSETGKGPEHESLAKLLGMTEQELQTQLKSGKTLEELAKEKGVTLPPRPQDQGRHEGQEIGMGNIAKLLGLTEQELQTQLKSGKTLEELAKAKGVTLPPRPPEREHGASSRSSSTK